MMTVKELRETLEAIEAGGGGELPVEVTAARHYRERGPLRAVCIGERPAGRFVELNDTAGLIMEPGVTRALTLEDLSPTEPSRTR